MKILEMNTWVMIANKLVLIILFFGLQLCYSQRKINKYLIHFDEKIDMIIEKKNSTLFEICDNLNDQKCTNYIMFRKSTYQNKVSQDEGSYIRIKACELNSVDKKLLYNSRFYIAYPNEKDEKEIVLVISNKYLRIPKI